MHKFILKNAKIIKLTRLPWPGQWEAESMLQKPLSSLAAPGFSWENTLWLPHGEKELQGMNN